MKLMNGKHTRLITDQLRPGRKARRAFPRTHTFKVTMKFTTPIRVADAQRKLREAIVAYDPFVPGFRITKVARIT